MLFSLLSPVIIHQCAIERWYCVVNTTRVIIYEAREANKIRFISPHRNAVSPKTSFRASYRRRGCSASARLKLGQRLLTAIRRWCLRHLKKVIRNSYFNLYPARSGVFISRPLLGDPSHEFPARPRRASETRAALTSPVDNYLRSWCRWWDVSHRSFMRPNQGPLKCYELFKIRSPVAYRQKRDVCLGVWRVSGCADTVFSRNSRLWDRESPLIICQTCSD